LTTAPPSAGPRALGCAAWGFAASGGLCLLSKWVELSSGPRESGINVIFDYLPATWLHLAGVGWPVVREGGDAGVLTVFGAITLYGGLAAAFWWFRRRALGRARGA
jgi:hypothetical protein